MMSTSNIIGLTGKKFHGKDTAGSIMKNLNNQVVLLSFASPIKKALSVIHEIPENFFDDPELKEKVCPEWGRSPRDLAKWLGTDVYRNQFDENIWLKNMEMRICKKYLGYDIIVTDVRFDNEAELIHKLGGVVWRIDASERVSSTDSHVTEKGIRDELVDMTLYNNGTKEDFIKTVEHEYDIKREYSVY